MVTLSSVIITRNEAQHIKKCLVALENELKSSEIISNYEIIVVDSNSSDDTLSIVREFKNIKKVSLISESYYSAAMGRKIGSELAKYDYILFLDGDIELQEGWLERAIGIMQKYNANGVCGNLLDIQYNKKNEIVARSERYNINKIKKASTLGGNILISRELLFKCGNYNPYLKHNEESEMYSRFLNYGTILQVPYLMGKHHTDFINKKNKIKNIFKLEVEYGRALAFKTSIKNKSLFNLIWIYKDFFRTTLSFFLSIIFLFLSFFNSPLAISGLILVNVVNIAWYSFKKIPGRFFTDHIILFKFLRGLSVKVRKFQYSYEK